MCISVFLLPEHPHVICITLPQSITIDDLTLAERDLLALLDSSTDPLDVIFDCRQLEDAPPDIHDHLGRIAEGAAVFTHERVGRVVVAAYSRIADTTTSVFRAMFPEQGSRLIHTPTWEEGLALLV